MKESAQNTQKKKSTILCLFLIYYLKCARTCMWYTIIKERTRDGTWLRFKNNNTNEREKREKAKVLNVKINCSFISFDSLCLCILVVVRWHRLHLQNTS